jgi:predicted anti-sigma-YlaC factor YlaD
MLLSRLLFTSLLLTILSACSMKRIAINKIGNALASGGSTYESDDDPDLIAEALPFSLKLIESLLVESPKHKGLLLAAASDFTEYTYAFVDQRADEAMVESLEQGKILRSRARRLYLRAHEYGLRGLDATYPQFRAALDQDAETALARTKKRDVPLLYWTAASLGLAISSSTNDPAMMAQLPLVEALIQRASELDGAWGGGAVPEFLISIENSRPGVKKSEKLENIRRYFERSLKLSKGTHAGAFVSYAENAAIPAQNRAEFQSVLEKALAIDTDAHPDGRLANLVAQRRARWLLGRIDELFLENAASKP